MRIERLLASPRFGVAIGNLAVLDERLVLKTLRKRARALRREIVAIARGEA